MSFWLNDNKFIVCLRQISFVNKILYSIFCPAFFVLCWAYFFYLPTTNKIKLIRSQNIDLEQQFVNFTKIIKSIEIEENQNKKLQLDFEQLSRLTSDFGKISDLLLNKMMKYNISCSAINPLYTKLKNGISKDYFSIVFKCKYVDFINFCREIEQCVMPLKFCFVKVVRWKDGKIKADIIFRNIRFDIV